MNRPLTVEEKRIVAAIHESCRRTTWLGNGAVSMDYVVNGETRTIIGSDVLVCCRYIKSELEAAHA
jgi:hypothetical protein